MAATLILGSKTDVVNTLQKHHFFSETWRGDNVLTEYKKARNKKKFFFFLI